MSVSEPGKIITPWAESGLKNPIPPAANPATGRAGFDQGFSAINMTAKEAGGIPPFGQDFNGIFYDVTNILRYMQAGGRPTFSSAMATAIGGYPKGAIVLGGNGVTQYQNQTDGNTNNPDVTITGWTSIISNSYPVGAPIPWPTAVPPAGFLAMTGQSFSAATYPLLAIAYPALVLPDMRAEFVRGWDNGRGIDAGRGVNTWQNSDNLTHTHQMKSLPNNAGSVTAGSYQATRVYSHSGQSGLLEYISVNFPEASGGSEARPRNRAFNYIVRAA